METTLSKQNLTDLALELNGISAVSTTFFDTVRTVLADIGDKIQQDGCGTTSMKDMEFENSLIGLVSISGMPDVTATLSKAIVEVANKL